MSVRSVQRQGGMGAPRGGVVVVIVGDGGQERLAEAVDRVLASTPRDVPILICDDTGSGAGGLGASREALPDAQRITAVGSETVGGLDQIVNAALTLAAPADVVLLSANCLVADGWLGGLRAAAYADASVATASPLTEGHQPESGPEPAGSTFDRAAAAVQTGSLRLRPRVMSAFAPCVWLRRSALELVGDFDLGSSRGSGAGLDFSQRCLQSGLGHVVADDVLVLHRPPQGCVADRRVESSGALARSLGAARRALDRLSLVIDVRNLTGPMNGTKVHGLELLAAVARTRRVHVTAIVPGDLSADARAVLRSLPDVRLATVGPGADPSPTLRGDVVHRPFQISAPADLTFLAKLGDRLLITHQDLISYHNPSYFASPDAWRGYRDLTRRSLAAADRVLFMSAHVRADALGEELVEPHRASVVHIGVDHTVSRAAAGTTPRPPRGTERLPPGAGMILCLGADFRHKNRIFALRVLDELQRRHEWPGWLVLAGPRVVFGSSRADEEQLLARHPRVADAVISLDAVSEAEKTWLLGRASLVLYPTVHEGFGLVPFEAADHGVPCLWAPGTALSEVLPDAEARIVAWDAAASADGALALIRGEDAAGSNVRAVRAAAARLSWDTTAERLIDVYHAASGEPPTPLSALERTHGLMRGGLSEDAMRLVGPGGVLPRDLERPLLALSTHPKLGAPVFRALRIGYRVSYRWRGGGPSRNGT